MSTGKQLSALLLVLIGGTSLVSAVAVSATYLIRGEVTRLSRETSPTQVRLAKLGRGFEQISGAFARISAASTQDDLSEIESELEKSMTEVESIAADLAATESQGIGREVIPEMKKTGAVLRVMARERIAGHRQAAEANRRISQELETVQAVTRTLSSAMAQLQKSSQDTLVQSKKTSIDANSSIKALLVVRGKTEQLRSCVQDVRSVDRKYRLNVLRDKARGILDGMALQDLPSGPLVTRLKSFSQRFGTMLDGERGLLALRGDEIAAPQAPAPRAAYEAHQKATLAAIDEISAQIGEAVDPLELAVRNANAGMNHATDLIAQVTTVSSTAAEVNARARSIQSLAWQLTAATEIGTVDRIAADVTRQHGEVERELLEIRTNLPHFERFGNPAAVDDARRAFSRVADLLTGSSGIAAMAKSGLQQQQEANALFTAALASIRQTATAGSHRALDAEAAQERAVSRITQLSTVTPWVIGLVAAGVLFAGSLVGRRIRKQILASERRQLCDSAEMSAVLQRLSIGVHTLRGTARDLTGMSEVVTRNVETIAAEGERMQSSIQAIANSASQASEVGGTAAFLVESATSAVSALHNASTEIGGVTEIIRSIALKTNLLSLNAAIEAAQAGELGAGFGVVATEVKNLASAAAGATSGIDSRVAVMRDHVRNVTRAMNEVFAIIGRIREMQGDIASAVQMQTTTTGQIAGHVQQTATECRGGAGHLGMHAVALQLSSLAEDLDAVCKKGEVPSRSTACRR